MATTVEALQNAQPRFLNDPRDRPFLVLMATASATVIPFAAALFVPGVFRWWLAALYLAIVAFVFLDRFILMLHATSHRPLFKAPWGFMNLYIPWVLGPFFGETPETYFAHHVGMHHTEGNLEDDLSTTMPYQRDSAIDFAKYFLRFLFLTMPDLARYLARKKRRGLLRRMLIGELSFFAVAIALMFVNWRASLTVFVIPVFAVRFLMMAGNWGQHALIDPKSPENDYRNSVTGLAKRYNRRCWNDGYHIGHHLKATRHWSELPTEFEANRAVYARERANVYDLDNFQMWLLLMLKRHATIARHMIVLEGERPSEAELVAMIKERLAPIVRKDAARVAA